MSADDSVTIHCHSREVPCEECGTPKRSIGDGGPAFPIDQNHPSGQVFWRQGGMSLRDWFAGMALQALIASGVVRHEGESHRDAVVRAAFEYADAMLKEREK